MSLSLQLRLDEAMADRVFVDVMLAPDDQSVVIDAVAVELQSMLGDRLSHRLMLPVQGELHGPLATRVELRSDDGSIPRGTVVVGQVWWDHEHLETRVPVDPCTELETHVCGKRVVALSAGVRHAEVLSEAERARLRRRFPWIARPREVREPEHAIVDDPTDESLDEEQALDDLCGQLGLDADCAQWLKDLIREDEE